MSIRISCHQWNDLKLNKIFYPPLNSVEQQTNKPNSKQQLTIIHKTIYKSINLFLSKLLISISQANEKKTESENANSENKTESTDATETAATETAATESENASNDNNNATEANDTSVAATS